MFDVGFSEIAVIAVVALIVIGPEKLPKVARTLGHMFGRLQRYVNEVKADINREMEIDELRKLQTQVQDAARDIETSMTSAAREVETGVRSVEAQLNAAEAANATPDAQHQAASATSATTPAPPPEGKSAEAPRQAALPGFERQ
ncbi:MAG TPA: Sec-independent protein translocase protein TatB [Casimicrobiaceae bacterium]|nr:Sec-independent protein translocase protein TatB [Casimicrobiaceae bacterium]